MNVPSGYTALDLIGFTDKGAYNSATSYVKNDLVSYNGEKWRCKLDDTVNHTPEEGTYWTIFIDAPSALDDLADVTISSVANGNILEYDSATSKWKNSTGLSDVKQALSNEVATRAELGAHNLFDLKTHAPIVETLGVTFVTNANKTVTANGQSTASAGSTSRINASDFILKAGSYIFSAGLPATGSDTTYYCFLYDLTNSQRIATVYGDEDVAFTANSDTEITVFMSVYSGYTANNIVYKPMIRDARDTDKAFAPFSKPNTELTADTKGLTNNQFENGCVNMLENKASSAVVEGVTFTVNADKSVSAYGTLEANKSAVLVINADGVYSDFIGKRLKLSGCPKNTGLSECRITAYRVESVDGSSGSVFDTGDGVVYEHLNNGTGIGANYQIYIANATSSAKTVNTTFKPMITLADMPNSDYAHYVPYAKSNRQLTELGIKSKEITMTTNANGNGMISKSDIPLTAIILSASIISGTNYGGIAVPYLSTGNNTHAIHARGIDGTTLANSQLTVKVYYVDKI